MNTEQIILESNKIIAEMIRLYVQNQTYEFVYGDGYYRSKEKYVEYLCNNYINFSNVSDFDAKCIYDKNMSREEIIEKFNNGIETKKIEFEKSKENFIDNFKQNQYELIGLFKKRFMYVDRLELWTNTERISSEITIHTF